MSAPETVCGGEAIVAALIAHGIDTVYGVPGVQTYPLFDALYGVRDKIRTVVTRHEQAAAYMAFGHAQSTGKPSVYSVVPGPGVLNTGAALCTALATNQPVLCLTGQVPSGFLGKGRGHLHEIPDQLATLRSITKWATHIDRTEDVPAAVEGAFRAMLSGRPGPAALEMCWDTMGESAEVCFLPPAGADRPPRADPLALDEAAALLNGARAPLILVGGGARHAGPGVLALAEALGAPVGSFRAGRGVIDEHHALAVSALAAQVLWRETDVLLGIGTRLELPYMRWRGFMNAITEVRPPPALIRIDIDEQELARLVPQVGILGDAAEATAALSGRIRPAGAGRRTETATAKDRAQVRLQELQPQMGYLDVIREIMPADGFFVEELCQVGYASYYGLPMAGPRQYITAGYQGTLGFGYPTSLGVKAANPDRVVISVAGDGGFMFGVQELATAAQHDLGVVVLVFNNSAYGNIRRDQRTRFQGRIIASELENPDFVALAESFGVHGARVDNPEALRPVLAAAIERNAPALIEIMIDPDSEANPWQLFVMQK